MNDIRYRAATASDAELLLTWVNSPDALVQKKMTQNPIPRDEHLIWFEGRLADLFCEITIIEDRGEPIGQVRLEGESGAPDVDVYIAPHRRRDRLAHDALTYAIALWRSRFALSRPRATVRLNNKPSLALFAALGFCERQRDDSFTYLELSESTIPRGRRL